MKNNQKGFSAVEGLLVFVIVAIIGFVGWYVWHSKNNTNQSLSAANSVSQAAQQANPYAGWRTLDHDGTKYVEALGAGYGVHFSLKYPSGWQYAAVDTMIAPTGLSPAPAGYNQLVPPGKTKDDFNLEFNSEVTSQDAQGYWNTWKEPPGIPDVDNASQVVKTFTTTNGYSALIGKTNAGDDMQYSTVISNGKGVVIFIYHQPPTSQQAEYDLIFNSVKFQS
jgi:type II secretory pathway pseudopilin PulG